MNEIRRPLRILDQPEFNVVLFGLLVNLPWEFLQVPFFRGMETALHWAAVKECTAAAAGEQSSCWVPSGLWQQAVEADAG